MPLCPFILPWLKLNNCCKSDSISFSCSPSGSSQRIIHLHLYSSIHPLHHTSRPQIIPFRFYKPPVLPISPLIVYDSSILRKLCLTLLIISWQNRNSTPTEVWQNFPRTLSIKHGKECTMRDISHVQKISEIPGNWPTIQSQAVAVTGVTVWLFVSTIHNYQVDRTMTWLSSVTAWCSWMS